MQQALMTTEPQRALRTRFSRQHSERWIAASSESPATAPEGSSCWYFTQRVLALLALVGLAPLLAVLWCFVRLTSRGPFLYSQQRTGLNGECFRILKIRTMEQGADSVRGRALRVDRRDPSVTRVGRVLRELKLDELPQLWNIVRGDMRFVGPRAIAVPLEEQLRAEIPGFARRFSVRPGLTNMAQICLYDNREGAELLEDWKVRFEAECHAIENRSLAYDLVVIALTGIFLARKLLAGVSRLRRSEVAPTDGQTPGQDSIDGDLGAVPPVPRLDAADG